MNFNFFPFAENNDKNNQKPDYLRKKYGIGEFTRLVDYSFVSKISNLNVEAAKSHLGIAFECEEFEIATCLAEVKAETKYLYIPDKTKRLLLAEETDKPNIQLCLAEEKDPEILQKLLTNPNLPVDFSPDFTLFATIYDTIWSYDEGGDRDKLIKAIWTDPKSNPNVLVLLLKSDMIEKSKLIECDKDFREQVFANEFFTPDFLDKLYQQNAPNILDFVTQSSLPGYDYLVTKRKIVEFVALHPNTNSGTISKMIRQLDFNNLKPSQHFLLQLIVRHPNTEDFHLKYIYSELMNNESFKPSYKKEYQRLFAKNQNTNSEILAEIKPETLNERINLILNQNLKLESKLKILVEVFNDYDQAEDEAKQEIFKKLAQEVAVDPKMPFEVIKNIIDFIIKETRGTAEGINSEESRIIQENPNLIINFTGELLFLEGDYFFDSGQNNDDKKHSLSV